MFITFLNKSSAMVLHDCYCKGCFVFSFLILPAEAITRCMSSLRGALDEVARLLPEDDHTRREYAQRFLEAETDVEVEKGGGPSLTG